MQNTLLRKILEQCSHEYSQFVASSKPNWKYDFLASCYGWTSFSRDKPRSQPETDSAFSRRKIQTNGEKLCRTGTTSKWLLFSSPLNEDDANRFRLTGLDARRRSLSKQPSAPWTIDRNERDEKRIVENIPFDVANDTFTRVSASWHEARQRKRKRKRKKKKLSMLHSNAERKAAKMIFTWSDGRSFPSAKMSPFASYSRK